MSKFYSYLIMEVTDWQGKPEWGTENKDSGI